MTITLDWYGCATYRLTINGLVVFLDTYMDRPDASPAVGMTTGDVAEADFALVGHAHWDHLAGADVIANRTGATVIASHESARVLRERGVAEEQLWTAQGGERFRLNDDLLELWEQARFTTIFVTHSVFESVFLSSRIVVMAARPGRIFDEVPVDAGYPRDEAFRTSADYAALCREASDVLAGAMHAGGGYDGH